MSVQNVLIILNFVIFIFLSGLHVYWVFGGNWGLEAALPESFKEKYFEQGNSLRTKTMTLGVAVGLLAFATILWLYYVMPSSTWAILALRAIGTIFILRAIGDFKVVGLFKKKSDSSFARMDNRLFIPLVAYLGISTLSITLI